METLRGALIGCGMIAREHLAAVAELENVEIAAVCDLSPARAEATAERFQIGKWYSDLRQLLADIKPDLMHITTPPSSHFSIAKTCLSEGVNVLCEKPITTDYADFKLLKQLAVKNGCMLMENQNLRFHSSIKRLSQLITSGSLGELMDVQICISLNIVGPGSPYVDQNVPHFASSLRGEIIGDFLPHIAYLAYMFIGPIIDLKTIWAKRAAEFPFSADEFRGLIKGQRATAYVVFSGNAQPSGFWVRVTGTKMYAECNLFEPPRITIRRFRSGEPSVGSLINGIAESRDVLRGSVAGFWRKLGGVSSYDGLPEFIARTYRTLAKHQPQPIPLSEIDEIAQLVECFTSEDAKL
jgi:predicted dehydrogenase